MNELDCGIPRVCFLQRIMALFNFCTYTNTNVNVSILCCIDVLIFQLSCRIFRLTFCNFILEFCISMVINLYIARPTYHFILIYTRGLTVVIKRICYVML